MKKPRLKPADILQIADFYESQVLPQTYLLIANWGLVYEDTEEEKEHVYSIYKTLEALKEKELIGKCDKKAIKQIEKLGEVLNDNDCAYIRFVDLEFFKHTK